MVHYYDKIEPELLEWAMKQALFFVASAPLHGRHVNVSPKGLPSTSFSILNPNLCGYVDATGSGIETVSHVQENGRCTVMFCSFEASPRIMRFFCTGRVVGWNEPGFDGWLKRMGNKNITGARAAIILDVWKVQTSCGYAVPYLALKEDSTDKTKQIPYLEDRHTLGHWAGKQISGDKMNIYRSKNNSTSLDGLPGLRIARKDAGENLWYGDLRSQLAKSQRLQMVVVALVSVWLTIMTMHLLGLTRLPRIRIRI